MLGALKYNLSNLVNIRGRDARQTFWYYVLAIVVLNFAASMAISIPLMIGAMTTAFQAAQAGGDPQAMQQHMAARMADGMENMVWFSIAIGIASAALLCTALVRRLHDSDHSGWWVLLPLALYAYALSRMPGQMERAIGLLKDQAGGQIPDPAALLQGQALDALIGWAPLILVVFAGILKSTEGANRFGEAPVSF